MILSLKNTGIPIGQGIERAQNISTIRSEDFFKVSTKVDIQISIM